MTQGDQQSDELGAIMREVAARTQWWKLKYASRRRGPDWTRLPDFGIAPDPSLFKINGRRALVLVVAGLLVSVFLAFAACRAANGDEVLAVAGALLGSWIFLAVGMLGPLLNKWVRGFPPGRGNPQHLVPKQ